MIKELRISNFIIVEYLEIHFEEGLQILSGETGAGKSIIVGAIDTIFGNAIKPGMIFNEKEPAKLEIIIEISNLNRDLLEKLNEYEIDYSDGELSFSREISENLRNRTYLNGRRISGSIIREFREILLDFHSQRDQQRLLNNEYQLEILDLYGNLRELVREFSLVYHQFAEKSRELELLKTRERELNEKIKLYEYQKNEIEALELKAGEDDELQKEMDILSNAETILALVTSFEQTIYETDNSVYDMINSFYSRLSDFRKNHSQIDQLTSSLQEILTGLAEAVKTAQTIQEEISLDGEILAKTESRLNQINNLKTKYRSDLEGILGYYDKISNEIMEFSSNQQKIDLLTHELDLLLHELKKRADDLSSCRKETAQRFAQEIIDNIGQLAIPDARVEISVQNVSQEKNYFRSISETGQDFVDIFFSANPGVKMQSLKFAASGGELSRFLLVVKKIISADLDKKTIVFDEIDSGIGGKTSELLGQFIHSVGKFHQVICITHLAQVAAYGDTHFAIKKLTKSGISGVEVKKLTAGERKEEVARMLSGGESDLALKHAEEILNK